MSSNKKFLRGFYFFIFLGFFSASFTKDSEAYSSAVDVNEILNSVDIFQGKESIIDQNEWNELELDKILEGWGQYSTTKFDFWGLRKIIRYHPDEAKIIIRKLVENDEVFALSKRILNKIKDSQDALLEYWDSNNRLDLDADTLYYSTFSRWAPNIPKFLTPFQLK